MRLERLIRTRPMRLETMDCFHETPPVERGVLGQFTRWDWLGTYTQ